MVEDGEEDGEEEDGEEEDGEEDGEDDGKETLPLLVNDHDSLVLPFRLVLLSPLVPPFLQFLPLEQLPILLKWYGNKLRSLAFRELKEPRPIINGVCTLLQYMNRPGTYRMHLEQTL